MFYLVKNFNDVYILEERTSSMGYVCGKIWYWLNTYNPSLASGDYDRKYGSGIYFFKSDAIDMDEDYEALKERVMIHIL